MIHIYIGDSRLEELSNEIIDNSECIHKYTFPDNYAINISRVALRYTKVLGFCLHMPDDMPSNVYTEWCMGIMAFFVRDLKRSLLDPYYEYINGDTKVLLRAMSDEELSYISECGMDDSFNFIDVSDMTYAYIKICENGTGYNNVDSVVVYGEDVDTSTHITEEEDELYELE